MGGLAFRRESVAIPAKLRSLLTLADHGQQNTVSSQSM